MSLLNFSQEKICHAYKRNVGPWLRDMIKKVIQQGPSDFYARCTLSVHEHDKTAACLRIATSVKAGNVAGGFFLHSRHN